MGYTLSGGFNWNNGYRIISIIQIALTVLLFLSLPLWKKRTCEQNSNNTEERKPLSLPEVLKIRGAKEVLICFFCYCALEQTTGLWASSFLNLYKGIPAETAAKFGAMFYIGITAGRAVSGFLTFKLSDIKMIRLGQALIAAGIIITLLPLNAHIALAGLILIGLGCAPVYPSIIHSTPTHFGKDKSQAVTGVQMAFAYSGTLCMPPLFGIIAYKINTGILPVYLTALLILMIFMHERLCKISEKRCIS